MSLNLKKYKRIFAFGCSFTAYKWPTWADIIAVEANTQYYNHATAGMGNLAIMNRVTSANNKYKFNQDDLVMIMWSTFSREDRWIDGKWFSQGNVWHSSYPDDWVKKYCDPIGHMIRDHAIINMTNNYLKQANVDTLLLKSVPFNHSDFSEMEDNDIIQELSLLYQVEYDNMPMSLYDFVGRRWDSDPVPYIGHDGEINNDPHPKPTTYLKFLESAGLEFSDSTKQYAIGATDTLAKCLTWQHVQLNFQKPIRNLLSNNLKPLP
jgi:hypothetical protein